MDPSIIGIDDSRADEVLASQRELELRFTQK